MPSAIARQAAPRQIAPVDRMEYASELIYKLVATVEDKVYLAADGMSQPRKQ
jgi:hypothetical protein